MREITWEERMAAMKFPPVGGNKPFIVTLDGKPFAGFDTRKEAEKARDMYSANVRGPTNPSSNSKMNWAIQA